MQDDSLLTFFNFVRILQFDCSGNFVLNARLHAAGAACLLVNAENVTKSGIKNLFPPASWFPTQYFSYFIVIPKYLFTFDDVRRKSGSKLIPENRYSQRFSFMSPTR